MDKKAIADLLEEKHKSLFNWLENHDNENWQKGPEDKWTTGQHALHLLQSIKMLNKGLGMPKFLLKYKFGKANRDVRDYNTVINRYQERLKNVDTNAVFSPSRNMKIPELNEKPSIINKLKNENKRLQSKLNKISDKHLDTVILPHPLMGKMPLREIIMWTAHHVEHHTNTLKDKY